MLVSISKRLGFHLHYLVLLWGNHVFSTD